MTNNSVQLIFNSVPNFRDIGGIDAGNGYRTACGRLYRSQMLLGFSAEDRARLQEMGLCRVYDLRGPDERESTPHEYLAKDIEIRAEDSGGDLSAVKITQWRERLLRPDFDAAAAHEALKENYQRMPRALGGDLAALCHGLAEQPDAPLLVHCSVGKDRTGFIAAALLRALDVPEEAIMADYLKSGELLAGQTEMLSHYREKLFGRLPASAEPAFKVMLNTHPEFLETAFEVIEQHYGGLRRYMQDIGVSETVLAAVREHLLEKTDGKTR